MGSKVRKQIYLPERQVRAIRERAEALGTNESELIRRAIDSEMRGGRSSFRPDPAAWSELRQFLLTFQPANTGGRPYQFNREEIYTQRPGRRNADPD